MIGKPRQSKAGNALYEQVVARNFQIIESFLSQFHEIFLKQDEFQTALGKIEHRISLVERNNKKLQDTLFKSSDMYEKKMNSLKQFILEKIKNTGQKVQVVQNQPTQANRQPEVDSQMLMRHERHLGQYKKFEQTVNQHIKKLEWQLCTVNQRINSLTVLTNNIDQRIGVTMKTSSGFGQERPSMLLQQLQLNLSTEIQKLNRVLDSSILAFKDELQFIEKKNQQKHTQSDKKVAQIQQELQIKISEDKFNEFKQIYKDDQQCMVRQVNENFANKNQTKKMIYLLEKKLLKLQIIEQIIKSNDENDQVISVVPAGLYNKSKPVSIHGVRKNPKLQRSDIKTGDSIMIRKLNNCNNTKDRL